jgi:T5SS/PEP-CTERM-associated repeat protein
MLRVSRSILGLVLLLIIGAAPRPALAQLVPDGGSAVIDGVTITSTNIYVGIDLSFTSLLVTNNAKVTNVGLCFIGQASSSRSNRVVLTGTGTSWSGSATTAVGSSGSFNHLEIREGAYLTNHSAIIGIEGGTNTATVSGTNSVWNMQWSASTYQGTMVVGHSSAGNTLIVSNGGKVADGFAYIGQNTTAGNNTVLVTDPGSLWSHTNGVTSYVGYNGSGNTLIISNGAVVTGGNYNYALGFQGRTNRLVVTGANSRLQAGSITLNTAYNELWIRNGGQVVNAVFSYVGQYGSNNLAWVTDPGSLWTNKLDLYLGWGSRGNQLVVSNGATVAVNSLIVAANGGSQHKLVLTGSGSMLANQNDFHLGQSGSSNQLLIADGATLYDLTAYLGYGGPGSVATVTGPESVWTNYLDLYVGYSSGYNQLVISNGARVFARTSVVGNSSGGTNFALVTGTGSLWSNRTSLVVGNTGNSNRLIIAAGGTVKAPNLTVSFNNGSTNNQVVVDGGNLVLTNNGQGTLTVRYGAIILNSGLVQVNGLTISGGLLGRLRFNGGTLDAKSASIDNGSAFQLGDGTNAATYYQPTTGSHSFTGGLIVSSNALLTGAGTINSAVTVRPGGTIAPGTSNILFQTLNSSLILSNGSSTRFQLNALNGTTTYITGNPTVTLGGTLQLTNVQGTLAAGMAFQIFQGGSVQGAFTAISPASPGAGLKWHTNGLAIDGTLRVVNLIPPTPVIQNAMSLPGALWLHATAGTPYDPCWLLTSTNLSDWVIIATNSFDATGSLSVTNPSSPTEPVRFYRLQLVP